MDSRLRAVCDLMVPNVRENAGLHIYDGMVQDLSPAGVRDGMTALGAGRADGPPADHDGADHDEAHLRAFEDMLRVAFAVIEEHRTNPYVHIDNLDLAVYDREYAPPEARADARRRHLLAWPDAVEGALASLDRVAAPTAAALVRAASGLATGLHGSDPVDDAALAAVQRLVAHVEAAAANGDPDA